MPSSEERWILVVEDNPDDEHLATRVFNRSGHKERFVVAHDGEEALGLLTSNPSPALVLLDLKLPRLSGVEVLMAMKDDRRLSTVPVVVLTSSNERTDIAACYELGCSAFVRKPIDYDQFVKELNCAFEFWLGINQIMVCDPEFADVN